MRVHRHPLRTTDDEIAKVAIRRPEAYNAVSVAVLTRALWPSFTARCSGDKITYAYAYLDGQPTSATDLAGDTTTYGYLFGDLTSVTDPDGNVTSFYVDAAGRVCSRSDPLGNTTLYGYDPLGDLTSITDPDGNQTTFT